MPRPVSSLDRSIYIHQFNYGNLGDDWHAIVARCIGAGANIIKLKALDGADFMGTYDRVDPDSGAAVHWSNPRGIPHPLAVTGLDKWAELARLARAGGADLVPWCVPHGHDLQGEFDAMDALANYAGKLIELDIEPYAQFWESTPTRLVNLVRSLFERSIEVWIDADIRPYAASVLPLADLAPYVTRWLSQSYWTTFEVSAAIGVTADANLFAALPSGDWGAIFPAAGYADFQAAADVAAERDAAEIGLWSLNVTSPAALPAFAEVR